MYPATSCLPYTNSFESAGHRMLRKSVGSTFYVARTAAGSISAVYHLYYILYPGISEASARSWFLEVLHRIWWKILESWTARMGYFQLSSFQQVASHYAALPLRPLPWFRSCGGWYTLKTHGVKAVIRSSRFIFWVFSRVPTCHEDQPLRNVSPKSAQAPEEVQAQAWSFSAPQTYVVLVQGHPPATPPMVFLHEMKQDPGVFRVFLK